MIITWSPNADAAIVRGAGDHAVDGRIPRHTVHVSSVAFEHVDGDFFAHVPQVDLVVLAAAGDVVLVYAAKGRVVEKVCLQGALEPLDEHFVLEIP